MTNPCSIEPRTLKNARNEIIERGKQIEELTHWKESAKQIFNELDFEAVGKELNVPLGQSICSAILPKIKQYKLLIEKLKEENEKLWQTLKLIRSVYPDQLEKLETGLERLQQETQNQAIDNNQQK